jgi:hypothetical protein
MTLTEHVLHVLPHEAVPNLKPGVLDGASEAVEGAGAAEGEEVASGLENTQTLGGPQFTPRLEGRTSHAD